MVAGIAIASAVVTASGASAAPSAMPATGWLMPTNAPHAIAGARLVPRRSHCKPWASASGNAANADTCVNSPTRNTPSAPCPHFEFDTVSAIATPPPSAGHGSTSSTRSAR
jgi:hypothetical protein